MIFHLLNTISYFDVHDLTPTSQLKYEIVLNHNASCELAISEAPVP